MGDFVIRRGIAELQIGVAVYRGQCHIVGLLVNARDHNHIAAGTLDIIHITAVHAEQENIDVAINPHQRKIIVFLNRLMHFIDHAIHVAPYDRTHDDSGQQQNNHD